jgi:UV DNA damage repair endonuclease
MKARSQRIAALAAFLLLMTIASQAQWVAVAHAVSGRIQQMQQKNANGPGGYDVATVVIEANAQKVYETAIQRLQAHAAAVKLIEQNPRKRVVAFTNGTQTASLQANPLGDKLTQLVVASTLDPAQASATSFVVKSIQNVCAELKVECTLETD